MNNIQNEILEIQVSQQGAELQNIIKKSTHVEYLWQGDASHWGRRSPVLFPIVGGLKEGYYTYEDKKFELGQHGFARDMWFELTEQKDDMLTYTLKSSNQTQALFPFKFLLSIQYELIQNELIVRYIVENTDSKSLLFSIGAHPAFNCPLFPNDQKSDYSVVFEANETQETQLLVSGTRSGESSPILNEEKTLRISDDLFDQDALILSNLKSERISIHKGDSPLLTMEFKGFPYFGIWSKSATSPFVCLEPWHGIADHIDHNHELAEKEGIISLAPKETFQTEYKLIVH